VMAAVSIDGRALMFAADGMKTDPEFVAAARM